MSRISKSRFEVEVNPHLREYRIKLLILKGKEKRTLYFAPEQFRDIIKQMDEFEAKGYKPVVSIKVTGP